MRRTPVRWAAIAMTAGKRAFAPTSAGRSCILGAASPAALTITCAPANASARESIIPSRRRASSMMISGSVARVAKRGASMGSALIPSALSRATMEEPTKPLAPITFHWGSDTSFTFLIPEPLRGSLQLSHMCTGFGNETRLYIQAAKYGVRHIYRECLFWG